MPNSTGQFSVHPSETSGFNCHGMDFPAAVAAMVVDQAPRVFAVVLEYGEQVDAQIVAWGFALDDSAYMTTADGKNQYALAAPEDALRYIRSHTNVTPRLVWAAPSGLQGNE